MDPVGSDPDSDPDPQHCFQANLIRGDSKSENLYISTVSNNLFNFIWPDYDLISVESSISK